MEERARALQGLCPFFGIRAVPGGPGATLWPVVPGWPRLVPRRAARAKQSAPRALGSGGALSLDTRGPARPSRLGRLLGTQPPCFPQIPAPRGSRRGHSVTIEWGLRAEPSHRGLGKPSQGRGGATPGQARSLPGRGGALILGYLLLFCSYLLFPLMHSSSLMSRRLQGFHLLPASLAATSCVSSDHLNTFMGNKHPN